MSASAFFPQADVSESGVDGAGVPGLVAPVSLLAGGGVLPFGLFESAGVLAFFGAEDGAGSGAPLHATAASATKDERQSAKRETWFIGSSFGGGASAGVLPLAAGCGPNLRGCALTPPERKKAYFMGRSTGVIRIDRRRRRLDHKRANAARTSGLSQKTSSGIAKIALPPMSPSPIATTPSVHPQGLNGTNVAMP